MSRITVKIIADSIFKGNRLTTFELEYPRYIHSELLTHRVFSRNSQSSRAIPVNKLIQRVEENSWYPIFMKNKPGMSPEEELDSETLQHCEYIWDRAKSKAVSEARLLAANHVHKQVVNRLLEPFSTIKTILTATDFNNFFRLRCHPAAQQEIQELACMMRDLLLSSVPKEIEHGDWHLPYITEIEFYNNIDEDLIKISTARCARVSYLNHDGSRNIDKDLELHDSLLKEGHMSPFEHISTPFQGDRYRNNFRGWTQYRWFVDNDQDII